MTLFRLGPCALASLLAFASLLGTSTASRAYTTDFRWANNPGYVQCVRGVNERARNMLPYPRMSYVNSGTSACNRIFFGHN
jgi:hypothetical protein